MTDTIEKWRVGVVGLGNIGSQVVPMLARLPGLGRLTLVDNDYYEPRNVHAQAVALGELARAKVEVQAARARQINPGLEIEAYYDDLANVPWGVFRRCHLILAGLDSIEARQTLNQIASCVGVPWIDAGVMPAEGLGRVTIYLPGPKSSCFECGLEEADYRALPDRHPCLDPNRSKTQPTNGTIALGGLVAALAVIECEKMLRGDASILAGRQLVMDTRQHAQFVTRLSRNSQCRMAHRKPPKIEPLSGITLRNSFAELIQAIESKTRHKGVFMLRVPDHVFVLALHCPSCGGVRKRLHLEKRLAVAERRCHRCGHKMAGLGCHMHTNLISDKAEFTRRRQSLKSLGFRAGDFLVARTGQTERVFEL